MKWDDIKVHNKMVGRKIRHPVLCILCDSYFVKIIALKIYQNVSIISLLEESLFYFKYFWFNQILENEILFLKDIAMFLPS